MNKADANSICVHLQNAGFTQVHTAEKAEIIIIITCTVRQTAQMRAFGRFGYYKNMKQNNPEKLLIICGCIAQEMADSLIHEFKHIDYVIGTYFNHMLPDIISRHREGQNRVFVEMDSYLFTTAAKLRETPFKAFVNISHGCNNFCTYCIVPYVRGRERSQPSAKIIQDINELIKQGVCEVTLLGQNVNSYGQDINDLDFPDLLAKISRLNNLKWIRFLTSHPKNFNLKLIETMQEYDNICPSLHLPVQSGSNKILQLMGRKYTREDYMHKIELLRSHVPDISLTTDLLIGFPGEQEKDFLETLNLMKTIEFDDAFTYKYSPRKGTKAFELSEELSETEKNDRLNEMIKVQRHISKTQRKKRIGKTVRTLCERISKKQQNQLLGRTEHDLMIILNGNKNEIGKMFSVKITGINGTTYMGEKISCHGN